MLILQNWFCQSPEHLILVSPEICEW
jgi:hypothetical protein